MKSKKRKLCILLSIVLFISIFFCQSSFAEQINPDKFKDIYDTSNNGGLFTAAQPIVSVVSMVCAIVAVILIIILGIKYMIASPNEKADVKSKAIPYVIGALILFGAGGFLQILVGIINGMYN